MHEGLLRRLTLNEEHVLESEFGLRMSPIPGRSCDPKLEALARLSALIAVGGVPASFQWATAAASDAGASAEDMIAALTAIAPIVGMARIVAAAPVLALALGYDVDEALERLIERPQDQIDPRGPDR
jgi:4-carboxymuconolactone decarboxylase